ncbi:MAG: two-component system, OmpR family, response regulator MprA [Actinomycetota bacterium]
MAEGGRRKRNAPLSTDDTKKAAPADGESPLVVLVVDDEAVVREMLRVNLALEGWKVEEAATGEEAIEQWKATMPAVVLLDQNLKTMTGLECASRLRILSDDTRIILFSGYLDAEASKEARRLRVLPMPKADQTRLLELMAVLAEQVGPPSTSVR